MKKTTVILLLCIFSFFAYSQSKYANEFTWSEELEIPPAPGENLQHGLAAPFAGRSGDVVIVAGGCNFPGKPVRDGGAKKYYNDAFVLQEKDGKQEWLSGFKIPYEVAYGASVEIPGGVVCIGGKNNDARFKSVFLLVWNKESSKLEIENWPELPFAMDDFGAAVIDNKIYVIGGLSDGQLKNTFLSLDMSQKGRDDFEWQILEDFPGVPRLQPVVIAQNAAEEKHLYVFSGSSYPENKDKPDVTTNGIEYNPKTGKWNEISEIKPSGHQAFSLHGACGLPLGMNHILFIGGVNREIFYNEWIKSREQTLARESGDSAALVELNAGRKEYLSHEPDWYKFNKEVLIYHTITDSWTIGDQYPFPSPAGAKMVNWEEGWLVINGETMPGIRSPKVYFGSLKADPKFGWLNWFLLISYLGGMLFLGYYFMKKENSTEDFFKGGGRIPWWAAGISIFATMLSAITFMAIPAKAYATDWRLFPLAFTILFLAFPVIKYYLPFFRRLKVTTAYEYLEKRFNYSVRLIASILFIVFMIARMAMVLYLPSLALAAVTGIDIFICIALMGIITVIYCTMGGIEAVVWGDVIQGFVLLGGALLAAVFLVLGTEGGLTGVIDISAQYHKMKVFDFAFDFTQATIWVIIIGGLANNLISYSSDQAVIQRYLTTKDERSAAKSILLNGIMSVVVLVLFYFIGTALFAFYKTNPGEMNFAMAKTDSVFPHFIMSKMPVGIAGILIAAIFSATMSTVSSSVNSISTSFTADIYSRFFPKSDDKKRLSIARWSGIIFGSAGISFALLLATWDILSLFDYFNFVLGLLTSGLGGLFVMGIFFPRIDAKSALIGFATGTILLFWVNLNTNVSFWLYGAIGIATCVLVAWLFSILFSNKKDLTGLTWQSIKE